MASTLSDDDIRFWRERAIAAEPYPDNDPIFDIYDGQVTEEEQARMSSTDALRILREHGIPLEK